MTPFHAALVEQVMKKTGICWVRWTGSDRDHAVWHLWHDGAAYVVSGGDEQPLPGIADVAAATVLARTKDSRARLVGWHATVTTVAPDDADWDTVVGLLQADRLNLPDPDSVRERWAARCTITRFTPTGEVDDAPGDYPDADLAAAPLPTSATTRGKLPRVLHRRQERRPDLS